MKNKMLRTVRYPVLVHINWASLSVTVHVRRLQSNTSDNFHQIFSIYITESTTSAKRSTVCLGDDVITRARHVQKHIVQYETLNQL